MQVGAFLRCFAAESSGRPVYRPFVRHNTSAKYSISILPNKPTRKDWCGSEGITILRVYCGAPVKICVPLKNILILLECYRIDLDRWAEKQVWKAFKNRLCFSSDNYRNEFWRFQPFARKFFERSGCSLDIFCLLFCVKTKRVSGV